MQTVRNLVEYRNYGGDEARAAKALQSHCPGASYAECAATLRIYVQAYRDAITFVAAHRRAYDELRHRLPAPCGDEIEAIEKTFIDEHPGIPPELLSSVIFFIHDWHHMR